MEITLKQKRLDFFKDLLEYYQKDPLNRRSVDSGQCFYAPTGTSEGCAIGRKIPDKNLCAEWDETQEVVTLIFDQLPDDLRELGSDFLRACQLFHDDANYWTETGLSEQGLKGAEKMVNEIESQYYGM